MRLTIGNLLISGARRKGGPATILARKSPELNPPYATASLAADTGYRRPTMTVTRSTSSRRTPGPIPRNISVSSLPIPRPGNFLLGLWVPAFAGTTAGLHRHFAVQDRGTGRKACGGVDDGVGIDAVVAIQVVDGAGLAEMLDPERL